MDTRQKTPHCLTASHTLQTNQPVNPLFLTRFHCPTEKKGRLKTELAPKSWTLIKAYSGALCKLGSVCDRTQLFQFQTAT
ncbi:hypothetical protein, partial [Neisseria sicca]